jgi:hypothetical protein
VRSLPAGPFTNAGRCAAAIIALAVLCHGEAMKPAEALDRYLSGRYGDPPACSDSVFAVQIDASLPALNKRASMSGFKRIVEPGHIVYRGLRFTGDNLVKTQVIARFLARESDASGETGDIAVTRRNYVFAFGKASAYNERVAYVFLLKPRRKQAGLFRGELWLDAKTAAPLRLWGDLAKSPSIFIRSFRFIEDYQTVGACTEPLRSLLTLRTRIAGTAEMTVWLHPASEEAEAVGATNAASDFSHRAQTAP